MGQFITRQSFGQFSPTVAQIPFNQFGGSLPQLKAPSPPSINPIEPVEEPQPPGFRNPFSPNELEEILARFRRRGPRPFTGGIF